MNNLEQIKAVLEQLGLELDKTQPHISGERFLMAKDKLVLIGQYKDGTRVAIKVSTTPEGQSGIAREKEARDLLKSINFAADTIDFPKEIYFGKLDGYVIWAIEFIEQEKVFVEHSLEEQFFTI